MGGFVVSSWVWEVSVGFWKGFSEWSWEGSSGFKSFKVVFLDFLKIEIVDYESGWDDVILIDGFNESFNSSSFNEFLFINTSLDGSWVSGNTDEGQVWESVFLENNKWKYFSSFFIVFGNDCLLSSESTCGQNDDSSGFETKIRSKSTFFPFLRL